MSVGVTIFYIFILTLMCISLFICVKSIDYFMIGIDCNTTVNNVCQRKSDFTVSPVSQFYWESDTGVFDNLSLADQCLFE